MKREELVLAYCPRAAVRSVATAGLVLGLLACARSPQPSSTPAPSPDATPASTGQPSGRVITFAQLTASLAVSYNERPVLPGQYGEEILANSPD